MLTTLKNKLHKTRNFLSEGLKNLLLGKKTLSPNLLQDLEAILLQADLGTKTCDKIILEITQKLNRQQLTEPALIYQTLFTSLLEILQPCEVPLVIPENTKPFVILLVGVNGAGKTTTIGKLANLYKGSGKKVVLACGDTFRAAAIEQLAAWGDKIDIPVIKQSIGSDSASVIFDSFNFAVNKGFDILIADTAGRLHTKQNLTEELKKIIKVLKKLDPNAPHEIMLVMDASIGQNSLNQAKSFHEHIKITGLTITKLDGTAKGGVIFSIADSIKIPIRYVGVGEQITDLKIFNAKQFISAICDYVI
ncbi:MAG: signal recognition particle-docking protein FtsY [Gammaproteobacteria bacterium]|jgi:fused signal recognition particle receptor